MARWLLVEAENYTSWAECMLEKAAKKANDEGCMVRVQSTRPVTHKEELEWGLRPPFHDETRTAPATAKVDQLLGDVQTLQTQMQAQGIINSALIARLNEVEPHVEGLKREAGNASATGAVLGRRIEALEEQRADFQTCTEHQKRRIDAVDARVDALFSGQTSINMAAQRADW